MTKMVEARKQNISPEEEELFYLLRTQPKKIKVRSLKYHPDQTPYFDISHRIGAVVNFATTDWEFYLASHEKDLREGNPLKPPSKIYLDFRKLDNETLDLTGRVLARIPLETKPDFCVGIPTTGEEIAKHFSYHSQIPLLQGLYKKVDLIDGGTKLEKADEAPEGNGSSVLIVDDVISKGTNSIPAFNIAIEYNFKPAGLLVLIDRQQGGVEKLTSLGYSVDFWKSIRQFLDYYLNSPSKEIQVPQEQYNSSLASLF